MKTCSTCRYYKKGYCELVETKISLNRAIKNNNCASYKLFALTLKEIRKEYNKWFNANGFGKIGKFGNFIDYLEEKYGKN